MILHLDGDAFFASCELSLHPEYRGKSLVVGGERGIITALTYEAKARGLSRGLPTHIARQICPDVLVVPGDYRSYGLFSEEMFAIVRRYADVVEEYSIDECFADASQFPKGERELRALLDKLRNALRSELGVTFSLGVAPTKVLAKIASKHQKPFGVTIITDENREEFLRDLPIDKVWGIGRATAEHLRSLKIETAGEFASLPESRVKQDFSKPLRMMWYELRGIPLYHVHDGAREMHKSIAKTRTFHEKTGDPKLLFSYLSKNIERACFKARRYRLVAREITFFLKTSEFRYHSMEVKLSQSTNAPEEILRAVRDNFSKVFQKGIFYRASGITLRAISPAKNMQNDLFGEGGRLRSLEKVHTIADRLSLRFGRNLIYLASSFLRSGGREERKKDIKKRNLSSDAYLRLPILYLGEVT